MKRNGFEPQTNIGHQVAEAPHLRLVKAAQAPTPTPDHDPLGPANAVALVPRKPQTRAVSPRSLPKAA